MCEVGVEHANAWPVFGVFIVADRIRRMQKVNQRSTIEHMEHIPGYASFGTVVSADDSPPPFDWLPPASIILGNSQQQVVWRDGIGLQK